ncbi:NAD-glutamate dehydrogenase [Rhodococcus opacus]|uniref:NAD-glutamate dehydrogenase n=1 Tax=Rhodococcus opacus TaxID=37919 RepID=UPI001300AC40|nr:NAD-glutamate dehydrogenase domain-containing protein [Rhodococcus opacus]
MNLEGLEHDRQLRVCAELGALAAAPGGYQDYVDALFRHEPREDLAEWTDTALADRAYEYLNFARLRVEGVALVRCDIAAGTNHAHILVVSTDLPFLVDSVAMAVRRHGSVSTLRHVTLAVRRDSEGVLAPDGITRPRQDDQYDNDPLVESWMEITFQPSGGSETTSGEFTAMIENAIRSTLADVTVSVTDQTGMEAVARKAALSLKSDATENQLDSAYEASELLHWMCAENFTFLGYCSYRLVKATASGTATLEPLPETGLGILRPHHHEHRHHTLDPLTTTRAFGPDVLMVSAAGTRSTVRRDAPLDYVGIKIVNSDGVTVGEHRFLGLFENTLDTSDMRTIPVVNRTAGRTLTMLDRDPRSREGLELLDILQDYPRREILQSTAEDLAPTVLAVLHLQRHPRVRAFIRQDTYGRAISILLYVPQDRFSPAIRRAVVAAVSQFLDGAAVDHNTRIGETALVRVHVTAWPHTADERIDVAELSRVVVEAARSWTEKLDDLLSTASTSGHDDFIPVAVPLSYQERFSPAEAAAHLSDFSKLTKDPYRRLQLMVTPSPARSAATDLISAIAVTTEPMVLASALPIFGHLGYELAAEHPHTLTSADGQLAYVYEFILRSRYRQHRLDVPTAARTAEAFEASYSGHTDADALQALVTTAAMEWRQVLVLRAYAAYLRQSGWTFSSEFVNSVIAGHPKIAAALWTLFRTRFDPALADGERDHSELVAEIEGAIDEVQGIEPDLILRTLLDTVLATLRTNAFRRLFAHTDGPVDTVLSFKLDPRRIRGLPAPLPQLETWVFARNVMGTHLRFGHIARGGIRWTDRVEDFRTEVLGLVRAQMVKNAVIVPTGAKGAFLPRLLHTGVDRAQQLEIGRAAYGTFVEGLLDLIDNFTKDESGTYRLDPAPHTVRHDGDDTYLVLAADKGTAQFSDVANAIATNREFWLGDAFASGGSNGYDHKQMGITARGAWESVRQHLFELGIDSDTDPVTAVGIGDMSGDVFGNGLLRSRSVRLVAAFDHRHIFLDPQPEAGTAFEERQRLYDLPGSSWTDYRRDLISVGGGVFPRSAKRVTLAPQARAALGLDEKRADYTPNEVVRAILSAPVDLLFNGGIGTYVRASSETDSEVGDSANDAVRITGREVRARVVSEGGNLGLTPLGRREAALHGTRLNTDAIDNVAGVDTSDHEVNIKIALDDAVAAGALDRDKRNILLQSLTADILDRVLAHNRAQNTMLSVARAEAAEMAPVHRRMLTTLEGQGLLSREVESLPSDAELEQRITQGGALTSPELGTLLAYVKLEMKSAVLAAGIATESWAEPFRTEYFPADVVAVCGDRLGAHPLANEIIATAITNRLVDDNGITFVFRMQEETGASVAAIIRAWEVVRRAVGQRNYLSNIAALDSSVTTDTRVRLQLRHRRLVERSVRWLLASRRQTIDVTGETAHFTPVVESLRSSLPDFLVGADRAAVDAKHQRYLDDRNVPDPLARRSASLFQEFSLFPISETALRAGRDPERTALTYFQVAERFRLDKLLHRVAALRRVDNWDAMSRAALRDDLYFAVSDATRRLIGDSDLPQSEAAQVGDLSSDWLDNVLDAALDPAREPELAVLLVATNALRSFAENLA